MKKNPGLSTVCVHAGCKRDPELGGVSTPIHLSSSYAMRPGAGVRYPRYLNVPNLEAASEKVAALEGAEAGLVLASGMAAVSTVLLGLLKAGDHVVVQNDIYGGSFHFVERRLPRAGIEYTLVRKPKVEAFAEAMRPNTRLVFFETPTNPLLKVVDVRGVAALARERGVPTAIDNTFATPINQRPLDMGVDISFHSATKYMGGHSDLCMGALAASKALIEEMADCAVDYGPAPHPLACWMLERSLKTLALRVQRHNANAMALAQRLEGHPKARRVHYPGLASHPDHDLAASQMLGFGGMLSVELDTDAAGARAFMDALKVFTHAVSLGGVESLACFPSTTSHAKMSREDREAVGITDSLIRLSVGVEDADDLWEDLEEALAVL